MGYPEYSSDSYANYTRTVETKSRHEIFTQSKCHQTMNPDGLGVRECRDSENHPTTTPVIIALDVTGSMGFIPERIIKQDLGKIVATLIDNGISDPSICFIAVGDHVSDYSPLQVGQFESGDQELVMWLERTWLEGHGGGGNHESYGLAWLFAAHHTVTDAWEKRKQKGFLFTIGDERNHTLFHGEQIQKIMGYKQSQDWTDDQFLKDAQEKWNVFHIHSNDASYDVSLVQDYWKKILGQHFIVAEDHTQIPEMIAKIIIGMSDGTTTVEDVHDETPSDSSFVGGEEKSEPEEEVL